MSNFDNGGLGDGGLQAANEKLYAAAMRFKKGRDKDSDPKTVPEHEPKPTPNEAIKKTGPEEV